MTSNPFIVDAYNLLFWCLEGENLERERALLIQEINFHAKRRKIDVTLVFDATWTNDPVARSHHDTLEIIFTAKGVTADQHILERVDEDSKVIVVTSDRALSKGAVARGAKTVTTPAFFSWIRKVRTHKKTPPDKVEFSPVKRVIQEGSIYWYEQIFEERMKKNPPK